MLLLPSPLPCVSVVWGCSVYRFPLPSIPPPLPLPLPAWLRSVLYGSMVWFVPPPPRLCNPPPCVHRYLACWLVGC